VRHSQLAVISTSILQTVARLANDVLHRVDLGSTRLHLIQALPRDPVPCRLRTGIGWPIETVYQALEQAQTLRIRQRWDLTLDLCQIPDHAIKCTAGQVRPSAAHNAGVAQEMDTWSS